MNTKPSGLWGAFHRFWIEPIRAEPVAVFRILAGLVILISLTTSLGPRMRIDLGPEGLTPPDLAGKPYDPKAPGSLDSWLERTGRFCILRGHVGIPFLDVWLPRGTLAGLTEWCEQGGFWWLYGLYIVSVIAVVLGFCTRLSTLIAMLLTASFQGRMSWVLNGGDAVMRDAMFYLLLMPAGAVWSVDAWLRARRSGKPQTGPVMIEPWSVRLAQIQLCCIYLFTGLIKLGGTYAAFWTFFGQLFNGESFAMAEAILWKSLREEDWLNGVAVYWVLNDVALNRFPYAWVPIPLWICQILTWATLVFEIGFPLLVLWRWTRPVLLIGGAMFHAGIWFHTEVGFFSLIMVTWYPLFLSGAFLERVFLRRGKEPGSEGSPLEQVPPQGRVAFGEGAG